MTLVKFQLWSHWSLAKLFAESVPGVYRSLKPFLLRLADIYLCIHEKKASALRSLIKRKEYCMWQWGEIVRHFGKDDTATAYLVSFLNLLNRVQSCNDNHLLLGANCEDHPLMKSY